MQRRDSHIVLIHRLNSWTSMSYCLSPKFQSEFESVLRAAEFFRVARVKSNLSMLVVI